MIIKKVVRILDIDFDIANTLLLRSWSIISGGILILIIPHFLSVLEQGYYFTFSSIIGLQVFFELGFNFVITQMISHEMVNVKIINNKLEGERKSITRIYSLIRMLIKWYAIICSLFFVIVFFIGMYFFSANGGLVASHWIYAWFLITLFSALNIFASPFLSVLEGMGFVGKVARIRLYQSIIGYAGLTALFLLHFQLNAIPVISGVAALFSFFYILRTKGRLLFPSIFFFEKKNESSISWRTEIFPFQWRIAISWISGYFIFQLFNPLVFTHQGAVEAGKLGLLLTIFSTILTLSMSWVNAKIPAMSRLISSNNRVELNRLFKKIFAHSLLFNILLSFSFIIALKIFTVMNISLVERLSSFNTAILVAVIGIVNHIIFCLASYMRAHKEEPLLLNSVVTGILVASLSFIMSRYSVFVMIGSYLFILTVVTLPWVIILFRSYYSLENIKN